MCKFLGHRRLPGNTATGRSHVPPNPECPDRPVSSALRGKHVARPGRGTHHPAVRSSVPPGQQLPGHADGRRPMVAQVVRTSSRVRADLDGRVVRYEVTETYTNRGGTVGEADFLLPLPKGDR